MLKVLSLLGIIKKAGKLVFGQIVLDKIRNVRFLFIASDASDKTKERFYKKCWYYKIPYTDKLNSYELCKAIGKDNVKIVGVVDIGFSKAIEKLIRQKEDQDGKTNI